LPTLLLLLLLLLLALLVLLLLEAVGELSSQPVPACFLLLLMSALA
jgi:hypothetical protein